MVVAGVGKKVQLRIFAGCIVRGCADRVTRHQGLTKWKNGVSSDLVELDCRLIRHLGHLVRVSGCSRVHPADCQRRGRG